MNTIAKLCLVPAAALTLSAGAAAAHPYEPVHDVGVSAGVAVGDVTAFDMKWWFAPHHGIDFGIGSSQLSSDLALYAEAELALAEWGMGPSARGIFYVGPGIQAIQRPGRDQVALTFPIGFDFQFSAPVDLFIEVRPGFDMADNPDVIIGGQGGVRAVF